VFNCLEEYKFGSHFSIEFSSDSCGDVYESILDIISDINQSEHHKRKWDRAHQEWAQRGM